MHNVLSKMSGQSKNVCKELQRKRHNHKRLYWLTISEIGLQFVALFSTVSVNMSCKLCFWSWFWKSCFRDAVSHAIEVQCLALENNISGMVKWQLLQYGVIKEGMGERENRGSDLVCC